MSVPNFSSLADLEVVEKVGVGGWCGFQVTFVSYLNKVAFELL